MATCKEPSTLREGTKGSFNARCAKSSMPVSHSCQGLRQRGILGRYFSTHVDTNNGVESVETKEITQRSIFAPRIRIRQIKVGLLANFIRSSSQVYQNWFNSLLAMLCLLWVSGTFWEVWTFILYYISSKGLIGLPAWEDYAALCTGRRRAEDWGGCGAIWLGPDSPQPEVLLLHGGQSFHSACGINWRLLHHSHMRRDT